MTATTVDTPPADPPRSDTWRWGVCGLLLLATMLNYMDRQALAQLITAIQHEFGLNDADYGSLEMGFGLAFAAGALVFGVLADRFGPRWLYPLVLVGWSLCGLATAYAPAIGAGLSSAVGLDGTSADAAYLGFMTCRVALGFFEAGHWPCALVTTQAILLRRDRSFGNSILQSGASIGAILTPQVVLRLLPPVAPAEPLPPGAWRLPFLVIGGLGLLWAVPWLALVRPRDLVRTPADVADTPAQGEGVSAATWWRMVFTLVVVVVTINLTWQFFRAWLPKFLEEQRGYDRVQVSWFTSAYYVATDVGCIAVGGAVKWLAGRGWDLHRARMLTYTACVGLTLLSLPVAFLPAGPLLLALLLLMGAGTLGLFPNYYAFTQELTRVRQGTIAGALGAITWVATAMMQRTVGVVINETQSYTLAITLTGLAPLLGLVALLLFWRRPE